MGRRAENNNVVMLETRRDSSEAIDLARRNIDKRHVFRPDRDQNLALDITNLRKGSVVMVDNATNNALALAHENDFLEMCLPVLWGDERMVHVERFGWLLRGAVLTFRPQTVFELYLVKDVVAAQWRLDRLYQTQTNVYENESRSGEVGKYGLPQASHSAMELDSRIYAAQAALSVAIRNCLMAAKAALASSKRNQGACT